MKARRIVLADDHTVARKGLRMLLERYGDLPVVADAAAGRQSSALVEAPRPEFAVESMPGQEAFPVVADAAAGRQSSALVEDPELAVESRRGRGPLPVAEAAAGRQPIALVEEHRPEFAVESMPGQEAFLVVADAAAGRQSIALVEDPELAVASLPGQEAFPVVAEVAAGHRGGGAGVSVKLVPSGTREQAEVA